jgi:hypothetical protein
MPNGPERHKGPGFRVSVAYAIAVRVGEGGDQSIVTACKEKIVSNSRSKEGWE